MPRPVASLLALGLVVAATAVAGCGEEDAKLLPGQTAREITANLDTVEQLADEGDCTGAEAAALQVSEQVDALDEVDPRLQQALRDGATRLEEVVAACEEEVEALEPDETLTEPETGEDEGEAEKEAKEREREEEKAEKEREREEQEAEREAEREEEPAPPDEGEDKGGGPDGEGTSPGDSGQGGGPSGGGSPSGGVSPSSPVEGGP